MKTIKIILIITVIAAIGIGVYLKMGEGAEQTDPIELSDNPWIKDITREIDSVLLDHVNFFDARTSYVTIQARIDDNYRNSRLGDSGANNETNKRLLSERLYAAYFRKFVELTFQVFQHTEWKTDDLRFIREESERLQSMTYFVNKDYQGQSVKEIDNILKKYDEIVSFISTCKGFSFLSSGLSDRFPISDVQAKLSQASRYRNNSPENDYVKNCTRLREGLNEIPQSLFRAHIKYLDKKIFEWSYMYFNYNSHADYVNNLYRPIKDEIDVLENNMYGVPNNNDEHRRLLETWSADNKRAYEHFSKRTTN